jgi:hypothetical protein
MSHHEQGPPGGTPFEHILQLTVGYLPSMCLNVVARLSVPDHLGTAPVAVEDIARKCGANTDALYRVMRALSSFGIFSEVSPRSFVQTAASDLLRTDHPQSLRPFVVFFPDPLHFRCYANLMHSVKTGETTAVPTVGSELFDYLRDHPEESRVFNEAMVNLTQVFMPAVLDTYDFGGANVVVDVGGGQGSVVAAILQRYPNMRGVLFDLDYVVRAAKPYLESMGLGKRCDIVAGSFFETVPEGGDVYVMKNIIHDWDDDRCLAILGNIRAALKGRPSGKVVLFEMVVSEGNEPHMAKLADIEMLALPGGRERTESEYRNLFSRAGFRLVRIVPTPSMQSVIEAVVAD